MTQHVVKSGEYLSLIAQKYKIPDWKTIYFHANNAAFRGKRPNPDLIYPGDVLYVPDGRDGGVPSTSPPVKTGAEPAPDFRYIVPGEVPNMLQASDRTCWATAYAMMHAWRFKQRLPAREAVELIGDDYARKYDNDETLKPWEVNTFIQRALLKGEATTPAAAEAWSILFQKFGPLWVGGLNWQQTAYHSRIACGIWRSAGPETTSILVKDPGEGNYYYEPFDKFFAEVTAGAENASVKYPLIRHW